MAYDPQLEWIAAANGMTPEEYIQTQQGIEAQRAQEDAYQVDANKRLADYYGGGTNTGLADVTYNQKYGVGGPLLTENLKDEALRQARGESYADYNDVGAALGTSGQKAIDTYGTELEGVRGASAADAAARNTNVGNLGTAFNNQTESNRQIIGNLSSSAAQSRAADQATLGTLNTAFGNANAMDAATVGALQNRYDQYGILTPEAYHTNISSDPRLVGQQQDVYSGLMGYASGANDIYSDPGLVAQQQGVYDAYGGFASGAYDLESQAATAAADPEALAAQKEALGEFRDRMDPKLTDAERFLYMQSRLQQEQSQRAARDANYRELERRGMGGSTMALSNLNASSAEAANTRALQDLGANAKAVDRAEQALVNYGNLSSTIRQQSFGEDFSRKSAADQMAINNNKQRLAGIQGQGEMANEMRRADDDMRQFNSSQRLQGLQSAGSMANEMRSADDAIKMFNSEQTNIQARHRDDFNAQQQRDAWTRDVGMTDARFRQSENTSDRADKYAGRELDATQAGWARDLGVGQAGMDANRDYFEGYDRYTGRSNEAIRDNATDRRGNAELALEGARLQRDVDKDVIGARQAELDSRNEDRRAADAERAAAERQRDQQNFENSFGQKGLLGFIGLT